jgi:hypothetical protein
MIESVKTVKPPICVRKLKNGRSLNSQIKNSLPVNILDSSGISPLEIRGSELVDHHSDADSESRNSSVTVLELPPRRGVCALSLSRTESVLKLWMTIPHRGSSIMIASPSKFDAQSKVYLVTFSDPGWTLRRIYLFFLLNLRDRLLKP